MRFVDEAIIEVLAGKGGKGASTFRREAYVPMGGPDGGDGGRGGSIWLHASTEVNTLLDFRFRHQFRAKDGRPGGTANCTGASGEDLVLKVPVGTVALDAATQEVVADLSEEGQKARIAKGGRGGRGNSRFVSSTQRSPTHFEPGEPGEERRIKLELRLIADVGLLGYPNAGKSTLLASVSAAHPRIADFPFSTLVPCLGVVRVDEERSFVMADLPGLIEGASQGAGLGLRFLKHLERTKVFLHLISMADAEDVPPLARYDTICRELEAYSPALLTRPQLVLLTKVDAISERERTLPETLAALQDRGCQVRVISAVTGEGVRELIFDVARLLQTPNEGLEM